jgi:nucleotide-binding universal stress UspA family protein
MKTILVPSDFSEYAQCALDTAYQIALKTKAEICLLNVCEMNNYADPLGGFGIDPAIEEAYQKQLQESVQAAMDEVVAQEKYSQIMIRPRIAWGKLASTIQSVAEEINADIIIMGTQGVSGLDELLMGSNTERVIRMATCPVLSIPKTKQEFSLKNVVLATTLNDDQLPIFEELAKFQALYDFNVDVLYMNNPRHFLDERDIKLQEEKLIKESGLKNHTIYTAGAFNEESVMLQFANEHQADLIAMGTHQRKGWAHFFFGSLTEDIANHAPIPVLSVALQKVKATA